MAGEFLNYFSDKERDAVKRMAGVRTRMVKPLLPLLRACRFTPDSLSYLGLSLLIPVLFLFESRPVISALLLLLYTVFDAVDGSYARLIGSTTQGGALTDIVVDQMGLVAVSLCLIHYGLVNPTLGAYYLATYLVMIAFSVSQNALGAPMQPIFRSKYALYLLYFAWGVSGFSLFNYALSLFSAVQTVSCVQSLRRIKKRLNEASPQPTDRRSA